MSIKSSIAGLTLVIGSILYSGCATTDTVPIVSLPTSMTFNSTKDKVWPLIVSEVGLEYSVKAIEKESGLITTDFVSLPAGFNNMNARQWVYPPNMMLATWDGLRMNMKILAVESEPGKTTVTIRCHYEAFENNVTHSWVVAESNGALENSILTKIQSEIGTPKI